MPHLRGGYDLRSDVQKVELESGVRYVIPFKRDIVQRVFDSMNRAIWMLQSIADNTDYDTYDSSFVRAKRRFGRIFRHAYQYDFNEKKVWKLPTVSDIYSDFVWHNGIETRTFVLRKTSESLVVEYLDDFRARDETISIQKDETDKVKYSSVKACGDGVKHEHAPYKPSRFEEWRYGPSRFSLSIKSESKNVTIGIDSKPANKPLWYRFYEPLSMTGGPYSYATFDMKNQTDVVKFTHNRNYEEQV